MQTNTVDLLIAKFDRLLQYIDRQLDRKLDNLKVNIICQSTQHGTTQPDTTRTIGTAVSHVSWNLAPVTCISENSNLLRLGTNYALERATKAYIEGLKSEPCNALTF
jgi:hypothetical protein